MSAKTFRHILGVALWFFTAQSASAVIAIYVSPPGDIDSTMDGEADFVEENFDGSPNTWDSGTTYTSSIGTYTANSSEDGARVNTFREGDDQTEYNMDDSDFISLERNAFLTLELDDPVRYFGFAWPAGDADNRITVYSGNQVLFTLSTADVVSFLPDDDNATVESLNGDEYDTVDYYGQPTFNKKGKLEKRDKRDNNGEPYAYIHIFADGDDTFDKITFEHLREDGGQFETDNHAIIDNSSTIPDVPDSYVLIFDDAEEQLPGIPEPSSYNLALTLCMLAALGIRRRN